MLLQIIVVYLPLSIIAGDLYNSQRLKYNSANQILTDVLFSKYSMQRVILHGKPRLVKYSTSYKNCKETWEMKNSGMLRKCWRNILLHSVLNSLSGLQHLFEDAVNDFWQKAASHFATTNNAGLIRHRPLGSIAFRCSIGAAMPYIHTYIHIYITGLLCSWQNATNYRIMQMHTVKIAKICKKTC